MPTEHAGAWRASVRPEPLSSSVLSRSPENSTTVVELTMAADPPLGSLGWQGEFSYDQPAVAALRDELDANAGIAGLE